VQTESESEETDGLLSKSSKSGKRVKHQTRNVETTDYLIFGMLVCLLACEFLAYLKYTGYSTQVTWVLTLLPLFLAVAMSSLLLHQLYLAYVRPTKLKVALYLFKFMTAKSYLSLLTLRAL
jgi:uncharacterized membrane protein